MEIANCNNWYHHFYNIRNGFVCNMSKQNWNPQILLIVRHSRNLDQQPGLPIPPKLSPPTTHQIFLSLAALDECAKGSSFPGMVIGS